VAWQERCCWLCLLSLSDNTASCLISRVADVCGGQPATCLVRFDALLVRWFPGSLWRVASNNGNMAFAIYLWRAGKIDAAAVKRGWDSGGACRGCGVYLRRRAVCWTGLGLHGGFVCPCWLLNHSRWNCMAGRRGRGRRHDGISLTTRGRTILCLYLPSCTGRRYSLSSCLSLSAMSACLWSLRALISELIAGVTFHCAATRAGVSGHLFTGPACCWEDAVAAAAGVDCYPALPVPCTPLRLGASLLCQCANGMTACRAHGASLCIYMVFAVRWRLVAAGPRVRRGLWWAFCFCLAILPTAAPAARCYRACHIVAFASRLDNRFLFLRGVPLFPSSAWCGQTPALRTLRRSAGRRGWLPFAVLWTVSSRNGGNGVRWHCAAIRFYLLPSDA